MKDSGVPVQAQGEPAQQQTGFAKCKTVVGKVNFVINFICVWLFRLRKFVMAAPVLYYAMKLADYNRANLPEQVGLNLQATGEFTRMISRQMAVSGPFALTVACLFLMFCSRKATYAWAISIFTLALPILLLISNLYPA